MKIYENNSVEIHESDGIIFFTIKIENITEAIMQEMIEMQHYFNIKSTTLLYVDGTKVKSIDKNAREAFGKKKPSSNIKAMAIYSNSIFTTFLGNFIIRVNLKKWTIPIKIFTNREEAINWLKCNE